MNFNNVKHSYRATIDDSIKFIGKDLDHFTVLKAEFITQIIKQTFTNYTPILLDVGCGHGFIHPYLRKHCKIVGVEMAEEVLSLARAANKDLEYIGYDGNKLPFQNASFDIVTAMCVMHHVPPQQWQDFASELKRVLKPGGIALIFEHNPYNPVTRYVVANNVLDEGVVLLSHKKLNQLMKNAGFTKIGSKFIFFTPFAAKFFRWFDKLLWWCPLGAQYYCIAKC